MHGIKLFPLMLISGLEIAKGEKLEVSDWMADPDTPVSQHQELQVD